MARHSIEAFIMVETERSMLCNVDCSVLLAPRPEGFVPFTEA
ncbi:hypothetical protein OAU36_00795 [Gammaproteobacteria bacterium]|nr:hypothetical protein [Gammaproteobacteria bacterium]MDC3196255.1 hypothetical protein [Gammaproteobacteria bacterium]